MTPSFQWRMKWAILLVGHVLLGIGSARSHDFRPAVVEVAPRDAELAAAPLLECVQLAPPVALPPKKDCQQVLMSYSFANSYGAPFVGKSGFFFCQWHVITGTFSSGLNSPVLLRAESRPSPPPSFPKAAIQLIGKIGWYQPPPCQFNRVVLNLTVTAAGRQFDRLAAMFLNDTEIWRTSTAEPTTNGIIWTYLKDVSNFLPLFRQPQKVIFDLGNIVDKTYTSPFNTTLTATFFSESGSQAADLILPISAKKSAANSSSAFHVPEVNATGVATLPRNVKKAVFSISANGQIGEEFWWSNVLQSNISTFPQAGNLSGLSPFRELQLYIDGNLAGVVWPFSVIFTGGVAPGFWRPVVGIDAFDLREDEIDITPWLPLLSDGKSHTFWIRVVGLNDNGFGNGTITEVPLPGYWVVTGKIFVWLDKPDSITTGTNPVTVAPVPQLTLSSRVTQSGGKNVSLSYSVAVQRKLSLASTVTTSEGTRSVKWEQTLNFENIGNMSSGGDVQYDTQRTHGVESSSDGYSRTFNYPIFVYSKYTTGENKSARIEATFDRTKEVQILGQLSAPNGLQSRGGDFVGSDLRTHQNGTASYFSGTSTARGYSFGSTEQDLTFSGLKTYQSINTQMVPEVKEGALLYNRHILAVNGTVVKDSATPSSVMQNIRPFVASDNEFAAKSIREMLGRGPST